MIFGSPVGPSGRTTPAWNGSRIVSPTTKSRSLNVWRIASRSGHGPQNAPEGATGMQYVPLSQVDAAGSHAFELLGAGKSMRSSTRTIGTSLFEPEPAPGVPTPTAGAGVA